MAPTSGRGYRNGRIWLARVFFRDPIRRTEPMVVALTGDEAALGYACELARKLRRTGGYSDPNLAIRVADQHRAIVFSIPLSAACA
jgi:hypothetical protein